MSRNPYHEKNEKPQLKPSVFVFMDILGYRQLIQEANANATQSELLLKLHSALVQGRQWLEDKYLDNTSPVTEKDICALKAFTDNIIIGWPIQLDAEFEFGDAFWRLSIFQFHMIISGFFVRGAISLGDAYVDEFAVSGTPLLEAYNAESRTARDPRIILTDSAKAAVKSHIEYYHPPSFAPQVHGLLIDSDGQWFLNYLDLPVLPNEDENPRYDNLESHKEAVETCLEKHKSDPKTFSKIAWVASYHNFFCDLHEHYFDDKHKIQTDLFRASPKSIIS